MCEPISMSILIATSAAVSAGVSAYSAYSQGQQESAIAKHNAKIAKWQAKDAIDRGKAEEDRIRRQASLVRGAQRARSAASGVLVDSGSPLDLLADTETSMRLDVLSARANAEREAWGAKAEASSYLAQASYARQRGTIDAFSSILSSASKIGSMWMTNESGKGSGSVGAKKK